MRKLWYFSCIVPFLTSCSYVRVVTIDHGQIVTDANRPINIIGNPRLTCTNTDGSIVADGLFVRQNDDGAVVVDEWGSDYVVVDGVRCLLNSNEDVK